MIRKMLCMAALTATALLSAAVRDFRNFERDGKPVLIPAVQNYQSAEGSFALPATLTVSVPAGEELVLEVLAEELKRFNVAVKGAGESALCRFVLDPAAQPEHEQGYTLVIKSDGIVVTSRGKAGLFYGAQTLANIIRDAAEPKLANCRIVDRPDHDRRGYFFTIRYMNPKFLPKLKQTLDVMAKLKLNWVLIELAEAFPFRDNVLTKRKNAYTEEQVRDLIDFCAKRHIELTPSLQVWSHAQWMTFHPDWEKMKEGIPTRLWNSQPCPFNAEARKLTRDAIDEHIRLFKPKSFFMMMDEFYLGPHYQCPKCRQSDKFEIFSGIVKEYTKQALDAGVEPILCQDSFWDVPSHKWTIGDKLRETLDPRVNILWWSYNDELPEDKIVPFEKFALTGHAVNGRPRNVRQMAALIKKHGGKASTMVYWYYSNGGFLFNLDNETPDSLGGFAMGADSMWKIDESPAADCPYDGTPAMMKLLFPKRAAGPRKGVAQPVPLEWSVNAELSASPKFPHFSSDAEVAELKAALAKLPERFRLVTSPGGKYYGLRVAGDNRNKDDRQGIWIELGNRKIEELAFLLTASHPDDQRAYAGGRYYGLERFKHPKVGVLRFYYADGTKRAVDLRYRQEIVDWNRPFGGFDLRLAVRGVDAKKRYYSFGIFEWKNPFPDKPLKAVTLGTYRCGGISPVILSVSARGVDKPFGPPPAKFHPQALAKRVGVSDNSGFKQTVAADFENGMGKVIVTAPDKLMKYVKHEIVADPASPSGDKVLKVTVLPGDYSVKHGDEGYMRISVDLPYTINKGAAATTFDHKMVYNGTGFSHGNHYIIDRISLKADPKAYFRANKFIPGANWVREIVPLAERSQSNLLYLHDPLLTRYRRISFFFKNIDAPVEIYVDNIGETKEHVSMMPEWMLGAEAEPH